MPFSDLQIAEEEEVVGCDQETIIDKPCFQPYSEVDTSGCKRD